MSISTNPVSGSTSPPAGRPKLQRLPPLPPAETSYHRTRKRIHALCFAIFFALPFFNIVRFDIPRQRFYFGGVELWISEFGIIFLSLMFLMFVVVATALIYGRLYCSYACPQMIFSEWSWSVEARIKKIVTRRFAGLSPGRRRWMERAGFYGVLAVASVVLAFLFTSYFIEPRDLLSRLLHLDVTTAGGLTGAVVTLITFLDFTLVRQRFCTTICPYGYLQGMLQDHQTLLVRYIDRTDGEKICIECRKCVRVCEMGIDIRKSPYQIECTHCGECVDACEDVLRRVGKPGLIHYVWGIQPAPVAGEPWYRRWGFRDWKRVVILFVLVAYLSGLTFALSKRHTVLIRLNPDRATLYNKLDDGRVENQIRATFANRGHATAHIRLRLEDLPGAEIGLALPVVLEPGQTLQTTFPIRTRPWTGSGDVNHFRLIADSDQPQAPDVFEMTFILPVR